MKQAFVLGALALSLSMGPVFSQTAPVVAQQPTSFPRAGGQQPTSLPRVALPPGAALPAGAATNFVFLAPIIGGLAVVGAIAAGGGSETSSTVSTTN